MKVTCMSHNRNTLKKALRAERKELLIRLHDQGCKTFRDGFRRDSETMARIVEIFLILDEATFSQEILEMCQRVQKQQE